MLAGLQADEQRRHDQAERDEPRRSEHDWGSSVVAQHAGDPENDWDRGDDELERANPFQPKGMYERVLRAEGEGCPLLFLGGQ